MWLPDPAGAGASNTEVTQVQTWQMVDLGARDGDSASPAGHRTCELWLFADATTMPSAPRAAQGDGTRRCRFKDPVQVL